jgi:AraC-like DNA-binding protein
MERQGATVSIGTLTPGVRLLGRASARVQNEAQQRITKLLLRAGIEPENLVSPEARIPHTIALEEGTICAEVTGDPAFNVHAVLCAEKGDFGLFEYLSFSSATLGESIKVASKYIPLLSDAVAVELVTEGDYAIWRHRLIADLPGTREGTEFSMFSFHTGTLRALGFNASPIEVHFTHSKPPYVEEYEKFFKAPIRFDMEYNEMIMPRYAVDIPLVTADPALHAMLLPYADRLLEALAARPPFSQRVRKVIREQMNAGTIGLKVTADRLHMSERTLRRRLECEGTRYSEIIDDVRKELAAGYLTNSDLVIADIARRIGFTDPPAFYRASKKWYGVAPTEYRKARARNPLFNFLRK